MQHQNKTTKENQKQKNTLKKMKKLWRRASGAFKDTNSICLAKLARRTAFHHPKLETAVIKATSHDESSIDYKNARRVFEWIRTSPSFLNPLLGALTKRVEKTRFWVVALKGLLLMHGVICCKVPYVQKIDRIPFDLSSFHDGHSNSSKTWGFNAFIRAYFAFLDRRVTFNNALKNTMIQSNKEKERENSMAQVLDELERSQALLDLLMQIRPEFEMRNVALILEVMDCTLDEIFYIYSRICNGVATVLMRIYGATQGEARTALCVLHKAASQGAELAAYFEFCRDIGVLKASEFPIVEQIPDEDIQDLERIIIGLSRTTKNETSSPSHEFKEIEVKKECVFMEEMKDPEKKLLKTVVTDNWVLFDNDELQITGGQKGNLNVGETKSRNPFEDSYQSFPPLLCGYTMTTSSQVPQMDLISF